MKKIKLHGKAAQGKYEYALVDDELYPFLSLYTWYAKESGASKMIYAMVYLWAGEQRKEFRMHRLIMKSSPKVVIDHKDGNTVNNQRDNLRPANRRENGQNTHKSTFKGVSYDARYNVYWSRIKYDGKQNGLGTYDSEVDAAIAYNHAALAKFGEFAQFNRIPNWRSMTPKPHVKVHNKYQSNNKSGVPGVHYHKSTNKWQAYLVTEGKQKYLGVFPLKYDAIKARQAAELKYLGKTDINLADFKPTD